ncbi:thiamine diphosphate-binding protein [Infundibulicybe gibba]|nr:thiamine diphosphate-binding protein [Infundibulicybe gibba]
MVKDISELSRHTNEFKIATSGRPRPNAMLVDFPKDVTAGILHTAAIRSSRPPVPMIRTSPHTEWFGDIKEWENNIHSSMKSITENGEKMKPQEVIEELDAQTAHRKEDIAIATGIMGFGLPAAIGAKVVIPHKTVVDIDEDASFSVAAMELATASQYGIGVKVLILNNRFQDLFYEARYLRTAMVNPNFVLLAKSMGVHAIKCNNAEELPTKTKEFLDYDGAKPIVIDDNDLRPYHYRLLFYLYLPSRTALIAPARGA